jgi:threonine aldolase
VLVLPQTQRALRFVTHFDVGPDDVGQLESAIAKVL